MLHILKADQLRLEALALEFRPDLNLQCDHTLEFGHLFSFLL